jgi:hypothetical protein
VAQVRKWIAANRAGGTVQQRPEDRAAHRQATGKTGDRILEAVLGPEAELDRIEGLIVGVERYLRRGELLLLIVGDPIRLNTKRLVDLLQERVNLRFTFGLVEMPIYATGAGHLRRPAQGSAAYRGHHPDRVPCGGRWPRAFRQEGRAESLGGKSGGAAVLHGVCKCRSAGWRE